MGSTVGVLFLAFLSMFSLDRLSRCSVLTMDKNGRTKTFPEIGRAAYGKTGYVMAWFGMIAMSLGVTGSYVVFISSTLVELTGWPKTVEEGSVSSADAAQWVILILPLIIVLSWMRNVSTLAWTSSLGIAALVTAVVVSTVDASEHGESVRVDWTQIGSSEEGTMSALSISTYPLFLGNAGYLYLISTAILPITQSMSRPKKFQKSLMPSIAFVTVLNIFFGAFAAYRYGGVACDSDDDRVGSHLGCVKDNVLKNMASDAMLTKIIKWGLVIDLLFTTIVFLFPINEALENAIFGFETNAKDDSENEGNVIKCLVLTTTTTSDLESQDYVAVSSSSSHWIFSLEMWKRNMLRTFVAIAVSAVALGVPFFSLLTGLTGGFGNNILGFILPPLFYYKLRGKEYWYCDDGITRRHIWEFIGLIVTFVFGLIFLALTLVFFGMEIAKQE